MRYIGKKVIILISLLTTASSIYAEGDTSSINIIGSQTEIESLQDNSLAQDPVSIHPENIQEYLSFSDWINGRRYTIYVKKEQEKKILREQWKQMLGTDIFYPYFKTEEIKNKVEEKATITLLKLKGKPELKTDRARFIFNIKF